MVELNDIKSLILDIDGILYEGMNAIPGAVELIEDLNKHDTPYVLLSNNTTNTIERHVQKLNQLNMHIPSKAIITAARVAAQLIANESPPGTCCFVIGEAGLIQALQQAGLQVTQSDNGDIKYVVIGMDRQLTYEKLKIAARAIHNGAIFISTNLDPMYMDSDGIIPASGAIQAALETATGIPARMTGKPEPPGFLLAMEQLGFPACETGMLGDQIEIDIRGASRVGIHTFLVLSTLSQFTLDKPGQIIADKTFNSTLDFYHQWIQR